MDLLQTIKKELEEYFSDQKTAGFTSSVVSTKNGTSLCVIFPKIREATSNEFLKLRELCTEYDLNMIEDKDNNGTRTQYFYIITLK